MTPHLRSALVLLISLSAIALAEPTAAQTRRDPKLQSKNGAVANVTQSDTSPAEAFKQARLAVSRQDLSKFNQVSALAAQHNLGMYVDYWSLRLRLQQAARLDLPDTVDSALAQQTADYIAKYPTSMAADLLRRDWMLAAGKQSDWAKVDALNKDWVLQDDKSALCYATWARLKKSSTLEAVAKDNLAYSGANYDSCDGLAVDAAKLGKFSATEVQARIAAAVFANSSTSVRRLLDASPAWSSVAIDTVWARPQAFLSQYTGRTREAALLAFMRLAVQDPDAAAAQMQSERALVDADKAYVWSVIAASSARKTQPEAASYVAQASKLKQAAKSNFALPDEVATWATRAALRSQDWKSTGAMIDSMAGESRRDPTWVYWKARADQAGGVAKAVYEKDLASIAGQSNFYSQLAAEELGQLVAHPANTDTAEDPATAATNAVAINAVVNSVVKGPAVARALQFYELNMRFEGNREWNWAIRGLTDKQLLGVARWAYQQQLFDRAVSTAERTQNQHDYAARLITPFKEPLLAAAKRYELDPAYVYGLIKQESRFLPEVKSSVGATGLMQLMPSTARWVAKRINLDNFDVAQLTLPETNLNMGSFYLRTVMDGLDGNPALAAAAYNAGPNRPRTWRSQLTTKIEGAAFAECIPFTETRDYVKKVLSNTVSYAAYFTGQPQSLKSRLGEIAPKVAVPADTP